MSMNCLQSLQKQVQKMVQTSFVQNFSFSLTISRNFAFLISLGINTNIFWAGEDMIFFEIIFVN